MQGDQQQRANRRCFERSGEQSGKEEITAAEIAQRSVGEILHGTARRGVHAAPAACAASA